MGTLVVGEESMSLILTTHPMEAKRTPSPSNTDQPNAVAENSLPSHLKWANDVVSICMANLDSK